MIPQPQRGDIFNDTQNISPQIYLNYHKSVHDLFYKPPPPTTFCSGQTNPNPAAMTTTTTSAQTLYSFLTFAPTREQAEALYFLEEFLAPECGEDVFVLRGAAGTGKTSLVRAVVDFLEAREIGCYLTAPTGRAAKVLGHKTRSVARTIHHTIYRVLPTDDERVVLERRPNAQSAYSVFVVDEASMLSDTHGAPR